VKYSAIASQMIIIIVIGTFGGLKLDKYLKTNFPYFTVFLSLLSVIFAIYISIKDFIKPNKK
jgi:F0F1-type ATP synthase assembly protein I